MLQTYPIYSDPAAQHHCGRLPLVASSDQLGLTFTAPGRRIWTVRDLVSRNLRRFVDRGTIRLERRKVIVLDIAELEAQSGGSKRAVASEEARARTR